MTVELQAAPAGTVPIHAVERSAFTAALAKTDARTRQWLQALEFAGGPDAIALVPDAQGRLAAVWVGVRAAHDPWALAGCAKALPAGHYALAGSPTALAEPQVALAWQLGSYSFDAYRARRREPAVLHLPPTEPNRRALIQAHAMSGTRDLINTPAEHLGPEELADAVRALGRAHGARFKQVVGDKLLAEGFPAIHAVGRAATRAPRLVELSWGNPKHPRLTIVGKGVCFDSGGLNIKPADGMRMMKKDMGGAAHAIGLAQMVMALALPVRLQLLIPAVENAIAGNAYRPGDIFKTRKGLHIEIGNTDAEGRVILCDALAYAGESKPEVVIDLATLTGAARTALGPQLPALFCRDMTLARELVDRGLALGDPMWHLPLWGEYHAMIESDIADIVNTGRNAMAGAITAALFLDDFVPKEVTWLHLDLFAWNDVARPGRPVGGEAQALRTLFDWLERRFAK
jgi:leucyl aminopeptidase